jgi:hypothetical protein
MNRTAKVRRRYRAEGRCTYCPAPAVQGRALCEHHAAINRQKARERRQAQKRPADRRQATAERAGGSET